MCEDANRAISADMAGKITPTLPPPLERANPEGCQSEADRLTFSRPHLGISKGQAFPALDDDGLAGWKQRLCKTLGIMDVTLAAHLLSQMIAAGALQSPKDAVEVDALLSAVAALGPRDGVEALLAVQAVALHQHALGLLIRAAATPLTGLSEVRLGLAEKLLRLFALQVRVLDGHRRQGHQIVRVEHVTVLGQAIVGNVHSGGGAHG